MPDITHSGPELLLGLSLIGLVVVACAYPRALLLIGLLSLAVRPELLLGGDPLSHAWGIQHTLLIAALAGCAWQYGVRREVNWPILALGATFALSLLLGDPHSELTAQRMISALGVLCLPWLFTQVALPPGSRRLYALVLALLPSLNLAVALLVQSPELISGLFYYKEFEGSYRLEGAAGDAGPLAVLAFAGFAVALHESMRPARPWAPLLATINLSIVVLTVTRVGILACFLLLISYIVLSPTLRERILRRRGLLMVAGGVVLVMLAATLPSMLERATSSTSVILSGGRDLIWPYYYQEFLSSPAFGRGFGTGFLDLTVLPRKSPHNEYLHILVIGGVVGFVLCLAAIGLWFRRLCLRSSPNDREFLIALMPALAMFAVTEDLLTLSGALVLWAYLGTILTRPGIAPSEWAPSARPVAQSPAEARSTVTLGALAPDPASASSEAGLSLLLGRRFARFNAHATAEPHSPLVEPLADDEQPDPAATPRHGAPEPVPPDCLTATADAGPPSYPRFRAGEPAPAVAFHRIKTFPVTQRILRTIGVPQLATFALLLLSATLAIDFGGPIFSDKILGVNVVSWHKLILLCVLIAYALCFGVRILPNWPVVVLACLFPISLLLSNHVHNLTALDMIKSFAGLAFPWIFLHIVFNNKTRDYLSVSLVLAPLLSVLISFVFESLMGWSATMTQSRLGGMIGAGFLACSAFMGISIALNEISRDARMTMMILCLLCALALVLSGSRMGWLATFVFVFLFTMLSPRLRERVQSRPRFLPILLPAVVAIAIALYLPFMESRLAAESESLSLSGRDEIWSVYYYEFLRSPWFGRGFGATEAFHQAYDMHATHNDYLRIAVDMGVVGLVAFLAAIALWFRQLLDMLLPDDRPFVWAMIPALALYGITDNILQWMPALAVFMHFGIMVKEPAHAHRGGVVLAAGADVVRRARHRGLKERARA